MGNKIKNSKINEQKNNFINQNAYLLCPKCFNRIPLLNTFIEEQNAKIKISCSCLDENNFIIMNIIDYLSTVNNLTNKNMCHYHSEKKSEYFCINCENWLCNECFDNHSNEICIKEFNNKNDSELYFCEKHNSKKIYLCKKCMIAFCKTCFIHHNTRNKIKHKGENIEYYLTEQKIKAKYNKYQLYMDNISELKNAMKDELLKEISGKKEKVFKNYIISFQEKYLSYKSIDEQLKFLFELIIKNCEYFKNDMVLNRKFVYNVILNTSINKIYPKIDKNILITEQMKYFTNFLRINYINKKQEHFIKSVNKLEQGNSSIEKMMVLSNNKFVAINKECEIQIYKVNKNKNIPAKVEFSFNGHSNNITGLILLRNKNCFATSSDDNTIKIWDFEKGICVKTITSEGKPFLIYEKFGKDNQIGCIPNRNSLSIYEYDEKEQKMIFYKSLEKIIPWIEGLYQFPKDGRIILSSSGMFEVFSQDFNNIKKIYIANVVPQNFLEIKNEDLIVGSESKEVFIYDKNLNFKRQLIGHTNIVTSFLQFDDNNLLTSSIDSNIILWSIDNYDMVFNFINCDLGINSMILINENRIITSSFHTKNYIEEWELESNESYD